MRRFSIRRRLVLLLLASLMLVWSALLASSYYEAREEANELADARLQQNTRTLMLLDLNKLDTLADTQTGRNGRDDHDGDDDHHDPLGFQVWRDDGTLLLRTARTPDATFDARDGYATFTTDNQQWRSYALHNRQHDYQVRVFESHQDRIRWINNLARRIAQLLLLALPALALLIWISIGRGLMPLTWMSRAIASRNAGNLEPINLERVPTEAQALIDALNNLLQRLSQSIDKERSFTADAAHELRTPLAAIKVQAEVALAAQDDATRRHAIEQVIAGVNRTTHLAQQLLLLARLDHIDPAAVQPVDLGSLAAECIARRAEDAARKGIDIECDLAAQSACTLHGDPIALSVMIDNLIDNAIKYGQENARIAVAVTCERTQLVLKIKDNGPGVPPQHRARLLNRFYRIEGSAVSGSGLGLSIVDKIVTAYGGTISLGAGLDGRGLGVTVCFPAGQQNEI